MTSPEIAKLLKSTRTSINNSLRMLKKMKIIEEETIAEARNVFKTKVIYKKPIYSLKKMIEGYMLKRYACIVCNSDEVFRKDEGSFDEDGNFICDEHKFKIYN